MSDRVVYKYELMHRREWTLELPIGARFLAAGWQDGRPVLWFEVERSKLTRLRAATFRIFATGETIVGGDWNYLVTTIEGPFVWHIYRKGS